MSVFQDSKGRIWICTLDGLNRYEKTTDIQLEEDGLPGNSLCSMLEASDGNLRISSQNGLSMFNRQGTLSITPRKMACRITSSSNLPH
jgi:ligand-binding sensor domain-containing protein